MQVRASSPSPCTWVGLLCKYSCFKKYKVDICKAHNTDNVMRLWNNFLFSLYIAGQIISENAMIARMKQLLKNRAEKRLLFSCLHLQSNGLFHPLGHLQTLIMEIQEKWTYESVKKLDKVKKTEGKKTTMEKMQTDIKISCQLKYLDDSVLVEHHTAICSSFIVLVPYMTSTKWQTIMQQ